MRSGVVAAAFVAGAIAVPFQKRDVVTDVNIVYATEVVTVTAGASSSSAAPQQHFGHHGWHQWSSPEASATTETSTYVAPTSTYVAPTSTYVAPTSTYVAPTTSTYVAPSSTYVAPSSSAAPSSVESSSGSTPTSYSEIAVYHHNIHRANHSASDVEWSDSLAGIAADIAATCVYEHNVTAGGGGYGQNIAAGVQSNNISAIITDLFYNGEVGYFDGLYGEAQPDMTNFEKWGHFSQLVWKGTTKIGCATQDCSSGGLANVGTGVSPYFTVCNYESPGNYEGEYGDNIGSPLGETTAQWNFGLAASS